MTTSVVGSVVSRANLQDSVDRFVSSLKTPQKLLSLHPRTRGHPGNAAALSPAIVLSSISSFEAFAENFTALMLAHTGSSFGEIAKTIGTWNNPTLGEFVAVVSRNLPQMQPTTLAATSIGIWVFPRNRGGGPVEKTHDWSSILRAGESWMQVRHLLTHGLVTGWRAERWPGPMRNNAPHASTVLRDMGEGKHSLGIYGAINCARIHSLGAKALADAVAPAYGHDLDWSALPNFR